MADLRDPPAVAETPPWPRRPLLLAGLGLVAGLLIHFVLGGVTTAQTSQQLSALQVATLMFVTASAVLIAFTLERRLWWASIAFSLAWGLVAALTLYFNGGTNGWGATEGWRTVSLFIAVAIAAPLFQAARDEGAPRFPYASVHDHAWTNIVLWCACWVFVAIVFALAWLLAALFQLINLRFLWNLLSESWFWRALMGLAFGLAVGLLRERDQVVRLLQRVVAIVLSVLAPVLAIGLVVFLAALPFTGLDALWEATRNATPILLGCVVGALILANAVIGNMPEHESAAPALRWAAMTLGLVMLPLAILAAVATGLRIGQYGFTPERLWALTFVVIATAFGLAYLVSLARGRMDWARLARPANLNLAFGVCGIALFLATPLLSFNAISTRDQIARLRSGQVSPEKFDWTALAFDFGEPGRRALRRLQASPNPAIRDRAVAAGRAGNRWEAADIDQQIRARADLPSRLRVLPHPAPIADGLRDLLAQRWRCGAPTARCTLYLVSADQALLFTDRCFDPPGSCASPTRLRRGASGWAEPSFDPMASDPPVDRDALRDDYRAGRIEIRTVPRRQAFVGDQPVGQPFE